MTEKTKTATPLKKENDGIINGISIASFLQMLEHEKHTCSVHVSSEDKSGVLYFDDGNLIDAVHNGLNGIEAAYSIVSWENSSIALDNTTDRQQQIDQPLGYILLNAAKQQDEETDTMATLPKTTWLLSETKNGSDFQTTVNILSGIPGIRYFYLLNKTGKIVVHSAPNTELGELLIYCIITSSNLRKSLNVKSPRRIHMQMEDGSSILVIPKAGKILGMVLESHSSADEIASRINTGLSVK